MGKRKLDSILVVDVESTCWEGPPPAGEDNEIIEIGTCLLDVATGERKGRESIIVRPERSRVSGYCTKLTTLTQAQVDQGMSFTEACNLLKEKFGSDQRLWASYGDYDRQMFDRQCHERGVLYPFGKGHLNVKSLFAVTCSLSREIGLSRALKHLGLDLEGTHHRGGDDAWNVAAILSKLLLAARTGLPRKRSMAK